MPSLKERRLALGMTQKQLAEKVGVPQGTVSAWESGTQKPARFLGALSAALEMSEEEVLTAAALVQPEPAYTDPPVTAAQLNALAVLVRRLGGTVTFDMAITLLRTLQQKK